MFKNLKIGVRLGIGFALAIILLISISVISVTRLNGLQADIDKIVNDRFPKTVQANNMIDAINAVGRLLRNSLIYTGVERQRALDAIPAQRKIVGENFELLEKSIKSEKGKEVLGKARSARVAYVADLDKSLELVRTNKPEEVIAMLLENGEPHLQSEFVGLQRIRVA